MILLGLGTNIGDREANLLQAIQLLELDGWVEIEKISSIYETAPFGVTDQADFLNMVVSVKSTLSPRELLAHCLKIEDKMGRKRTQHWGPRVIDIDLLIYDKFQICDEFLMLPHPGMSYRAFVLVPILDIACDIQLAGESTAEELLINISELDAQAVRLWKRTTWDSIKKCFV
jgi:2-amino-4-hydroxy-6-hydroxymethyldihydropteridine diphosphokinase